MRIHRVGPRPCRVGARSYRVWILLAAALCAACGKPGPTLELLTVNQTNCPEIQELRIRFTNQEPKEIRPRFFIQVTTAQPVCWTIADGSRVLQPGEKSVYTLRAPLTENGIMPGKDAVITARDRDFQSNQLIHIPLPSQDLPPVFNPDFTYYQFEQSRSTRVPMHWNVQRQNLPLAALGSFSDTAGDNWYFRILFPRHEAGQRVRISQEIRCHDRQLEVIFSSDIPLALSGNTIQFAFSTPASRVEYIIRQNLPRPVVVKKEPGSAGGQPDRTLILVRAPVGRKVRLRLEPWKWMKDQTETMMMVINAVKKEKDQQRYFIIDRVDYIDSGVIRPRS